jgi:hypothetical protein
MNKIALKAISDKHVDISPVVDKSGKLLGVRIIGCSIKPYLRSKVISLRFFTDEAKDFISSKLNHNYKD